MTAAQAEQQPQQEAGTLRSIFDVGARIFQGLREFADPGTYWNPDQTTHHGRDTVMGEINYLFSHEALFDTAAIEERQTVSPRPSRLFSFDQGVPSHAPEAFVEAVTAQGGASESDAQTIWELFPKSQRAGTMSQIYPRPPKIPRRAPGPFVEAFARQGVEQGVAEKVARKEAKKRWRSMRDEEQLAIMQQIGS